MNNLNIAKLIDHTLLRPDATVDDIRRLCDEARQYGFYSVCVNPFFVPMVREMLSGSEVKITTVIGFPLGMTNTNAKVYEAVEALNNGVDEIDMVINIGMARTGRWDLVKKDILDVICATKRIVHKVIIETCYLSRDEKIKATETVTETGAEFVKTSTGFGPSGASVDDVKLIKSIVKDSCGIKASGGIKTLAQARELIAAGATRIGTSNGVSIIEEQQ